MDEIDEQTRRETGSYNPVEVEEMDMSLVMHRARMFDLLLATLEEEKATLECWRKGIDHRSNSAWELRQQAGDLYEAFGQGIQILAQVLQKAKGEGA